MDIVRAFTFSFEDRAWVEKLLITAVIAFVTVLLTPLIVGLLGWAALLGYQVELVRNWRAETPFPLPAWNDFMRILNTGFYPLVALLVYQIPNIIIGGTMLTLGQNLGAGVVGSVLLFTLSCCLAPILILYNVVALPMFALGMGRFANDPRLNVFFEIGYLLVTLRDNLGVSVLYLIFLIVVDIIIAFIGILPLIGWLAILAFATPVFGALNAQLSMAILGKTKRKEREEVQPKPKRRPNPPSRRR